MPAERFYVDAPLEGVVTISGLEHHHLAHVMRIRVSEEVEIVNGKGSLATAKVQGISKHEALLEILSSSDTPTPLPHLKLAIPLMRPSKLELIIEKCTELGADAFYLYAAHFSEKDDLSDHQFERLEGIAISAMKQCGRLFLPSLEKVSFEEVLDLPGKLLFGDPRSTQPIEETSGEIVFVTGPEKGFFSKELEELEKKGTGVSLHKNILRAETAPIVASALILN